jgi:hypothetical protein
VTIDDVIARFIAVWGEPKTDHGDLFIAEYRRSLANTDGDVLEAAASAAIDGEDYWPRPAALRRHVSTAAARLQALRRPAEHRPIDPTPPSPEQVARVGQMMADLKRSLSAINDAFTPPPPPPKADRDTFAAMQAASPNRELHSDQSRRMTGEAT